MSKYLVIFGEMADIIHGEKAAQELADSIGPEAVVVPLKQALAAPDLLEACEEYLRQFEERATRHPDRKTKSTLDNAVLPKVRAALAKAKGGAA